MTIDIVERVGNERVNLNALIGIFRVWSDISHLTIVLLQK